MKIFDYKLALTLTAIAIGFVSCNKDDNESITPSTITNITSEALPGEIVIKWDKEDPITFEYLKVEYYDNLLKKNVVRLASPQAEGITLPNTRAKYGEYDVTITPVSRTRTEGTPINVKATSGPAIATYSLTPEEDSRQITLTADMLSTNAQEPSEGPIANLVDGNVNTFFHTAWSVAIGAQHYFQVTLPEAVQGFRYETNLRVTYKAQGVKRMQVEASNDGDTWVTVVAQHLYSEPSEGTANMPSPAVVMENKYKMFRFTPLARFNADPLTKSWFHMSEFRFFEEPISIIDPEAPSDDD